MSISRKRVQKIKDGRAEPRTKVEWAILNRDITRKNTVRLMTLHNSAAIRTGALSAGKIVVVPPSRETA